MPDAKVMGWSNRARPQQSKSSTMNTSDPAFSTRVVAAADISAAARLLQYLDDGPVALPAEITEEIRENWHAQPRIRRPHGRKVPRPDRLAPEEDPGEAARDRAHGEEGLCGRRQGRRPGQPIIRQN